MQHQRKGKGKSKGRKSDDHVTVGRDLTSSHSLQGIRFRQRVVVGLTNRSLDGASPPTAIHLDFTPTSAQQKLFEEYVVESATLFLAMGPFTTGLQCVGMAIAYDPATSVTTLTNQGMVLNHNDGDAFFLTTYQPLKSYRVSNPSHPVLGSVFDSVTGITESREPVRIDQTWNCGHFYVIPIESNVQYMDTWVEYVVSFRHPRVDG
jgi:hypothetical protein